MKTSVKLLGCMVLSLGLAVSAMAQEATPVSKVLITNANILDSNKGTLAEGMSLLVEGNTIAKIATSIPAPDGATVIDAKGRTITPGLIDAHVHLMWNMGEVQLTYASPDYIAALTLAEAKATLMRGYTSVRDTGGQVLGAKKAIDQGFFEGPRIWACGAGIGMTAGHVDLRPYADQSRSLGGPSGTAYEAMGVAILADGVPEALAASRMQMRKGAHFLKTFTSGAVSGLYDPLDITEYSLDELKAVVGEAKRWNTYVAIHSYNDAGTQQGLEAGAMSVEHANLLSESTMKMIAEKGAFLSTQTGVYLQPAPSGWTDDQKAKQKAAQDGLDTLFTLAKKYQVKIAIGTDLVGSMEAKKLQAFELTNRLKWFTPAEILKQATVNNAELLSWSGPRNPYPGTLGVIEEGALADLLLVDGNPLENLKLFNEPEKNLVLIMKDGTIYKNTLD